MIKTVLVIDDNEDYRDSLCLALEGQGLDVITSDSPDHAYSLLKGGDRPDLIVCDLHMPFTQGPLRDEFETSSRVGVKTIQELQWVYPDSTVIAMTSLPDLEVTRIRGQLEPVPAYTKPDKISDVVDLVCAYLESPCYGGVN